MSLFNATIEACNTGFPFSDRKGGIAQLTLALLPFHTGTTALFAVAPPQAMLVRDLAIEGREALPADVGLDPCGSPCIISICY